MKNRSFTAVIVFLLALCLLSACGDPMPSSALPPKDFTSSLPLIRATVDMLLYDQDGLKIYLQAIEKRSSAYIFLFLLENGSEKDVNLFWCNETYFDDFGIPASRGKSSFPPPSGESKLLEYYYHYADFRDMGLDYQCAKCVEGILTLIIDEDFRNPVNIPFSVDLRDYFHQADSPIELVPFSGEAFYDSGGIKLSVQCIEKTNLHYKVLIRIENDSVHSIRVSPHPESLVNGTAVSLSDGSTINPAPGKTGNMSIYLHKSNTDAAELDFEGIETLEGVISLKVDRGGIASEIPFSIRFSDYEIGEE